MEITNKKQAMKLLKGRKIVNVELNRFDTGNGRQKTSNPSIVLDDGSSICFSVDEISDGSDYGIALLYVPSLPQAVESLHKAEAAILAETRKPNALTHQCGCRHCTACGFTFESDACGEYHDGELCDLHKDLQPDFIG